MKKITPTALEMTDAAVSDVVALHQYWRRGDSFAYESQGRRNHGIVFFLTDGPLYTFPDGSSFRPRTGCVIFLPKGAHYVVRCDKESAESLLAVFLLRDSDGEELSLFDEIYHFYPNERVIPERLHEICSTYQTSVGNRLLIHSCLYRILHELSRDMNGFEDSVISPALAYINTNLMSDISIPRLAEMCSVSESTFRREFRREMQTTPLRYIIGERLDKARQLLTESDLSVASIAEAAGFYDEATFCKTFRKKYGLTPFRYRRSRRI